MLSLVLTLPELGPFWITSERLLLSAFTIPIVSDKVLLMVPKPGSNEETVLQNVSKVSGPFTPELGGLLIGIIIFTGLLSVWFSDRPKSPLGEGQSSAPLRRSKRAYLRLAIDSILEKGMFFCSAGVEQDAGSTLPNKLLMFGFGFFILIAVRLCLSYSIFPVTTIIISQFYLICSFCAVHTWQTWQHF